MILARLIDNLDKCKLKNATWISLIADTRKDEFCRFRGFVRVLEHLPMLLSEVRREC